MGSACDTGEQNAARVVHGDGMCGPSALMAF